MEKAFVILVFLPSFAFAALSPIPRPAQKPVPVVEAPVEPVPAKVEPLILSKIVPVISVYPNGKIKLQGKATWEDASYALLQHMKELAGACDQKSSEQK